MAEMTATLKIETDPQVFQVAALADRLERLIEIFKDCTVRVLNLKPGDVIVLESAQKMTMQAYENLLANARIVWPDNQVGLLEQGLHLAGVTRPV